MSVLTKTALVYSCMFALLLLVLAPFSTIGGAAFEDGFADLLAGIAPMIFSPLVFAVLAEVVIRVVRPKRLTGLAMRVSWLQIIGQVFLLNFLISSTVSEEDGLGVLALVLLAAASLASVLLRGTFKGLPSVWLVNVCAASVIVGTFPIALLIAHGVESGSDGLFVLKLICACMMIGIASYVNYLNSIKEKGA